MEDFGLTCLRVKLAKQGWNQTDIDQLFSGVYDVNELKSMKRIVETCYEIVNGLTNGNAQTLGLIKGFIDVFNANLNTENISQININATKDEFGDWTFTVGVQ